MNKSPERDLVELPFITQLIAMGWRHTPGNIDHPTVTGRATFGEVLLRDDLSAALRRINLRAGAPWLDSQRIEQAIAVLERQPAGKLIEVNRNATALLLAGTTVDPLPEDHDRAPTVRYVDWDNPANNTFRVIDQLRVDEPGTHGRKYVVPDIVLFVNGIPFVVVECKSPHVPEPIARAIDDLQSYGNQRAWIPGNEGNEQLFHTNQLLIATSYDEARVGTVAAQAPHYMEWKDTVPVRLAAVARFLRKPRLSSQETLVAGMLRPRNLLDIVRHFVLFRTEEGRLVKHVCRYPQYRAVQSAVRSLKHGKTREQDGEHDRRGGVVWHTQGSGKSLTMVFLIRRMRSDPTLREFKIVVVTDRSQLEDQLVETAHLTGEHLLRIKPQRRGGRTVHAAEVLKRTLRRPGRALVFAMIQKYRDDDDGKPPDPAAVPAGILDGKVGELNASSKILVIVDEAHRSHTGPLHANLRKALPNCARIGFTGTPILRDAKKLTLEIFGPILDRYLLRQSELDGATVRILYEGRTADARVRGGGRLDDLFDDMFRTWSPAEITALQKRYATRGDVLEAPALIADKARDILRHYVENILPNGFKAQVVAVSRRAAVRYREALLVARDDLVSVLATIDPAASQVEGALDADTAFHLRAQRFLPLLRALELAPVISPGGDDDPSWAEWTDPGRQKERIERFKRRLSPEDTEETSPLAFLIVKSMLLTGFDAPVEQALYLDRRMVGAELLQTIARVNRRAGPKKEAGVVVDYFGVVGHLDDALAAYSAEDIAGALRDLTREEMEELEQDHRAVVELLADAGAPDLTDTSACVAVLEDEPTRRDFNRRLKAFLGALDIVLPRPEALPYVPDAKTLSFIQARARNLYRDRTRPMGADVGEKVRKLIDDHIVSEGIDLQIPPISLTDPRFAEHVEAAPTARDQAMELRHAIRDHIEQHEGEDPAHYQRLSERLAGILDDFDGQWEKMREALERMAKDVAAGRAPDETGLPQTHLPFFDEIRRAAAGKGEIDAPARERLAAQTSAVVEQIQKVVRHVDFWKKGEAQENLRKWIFQFLAKNVSDGGDDPKKWADVAEQLVDLARRNDAKLRGAP